MRILDYPRHFLLLGGGAMALAGMTRLPSLFAGRLLLLFGVVGALHAMAVVLGLRSRPSWPACLGFVAAAAGASIAAPLGALALAGLVKLDVGAVVFLSLAPTSAVGAVLYWLLLRGWWAQFLTSRSLLVTVAACVAATLITALAIGLMPLPRDLLLPVLWWLAFSASRQVADR
jgi:hypothetical protein